MKIIVFLGPTLPVSEARRELDAVYLPPAAQGDVYLAAKERPLAIGIVDGVFDQRPAVAHKEILFAMAEGIHVFGAASMGALRAVELAPFGMEGVGAVFEDYQRGELDCDDEVAVAHASAEEGYRPLSEAMVNVRATLAAAEEAGALDSAARQTVTLAAKRLFYADRTWPMILRRSAAAGLSAATLEALQGFLHRGRVHRKRDDALALLRLLRDRASLPAPPTMPPAPVHGRSPAGARQPLSAAPAGPATAHRPSSGEATPRVPPLAVPKRVDYELERTDAWEHVRRTAEARASGAGGRSPLEQAIVRLLAEDGTLEAELHGALGRALAIDLAQRQGRATIEGPALAGAIEAFRCARGLFHPDDVIRWVEENQIRDTPRFFRAEAMLRWARTVGAAEAERQLLDHLRSTGRYASLAARLRSSEK